MTDFAKVTEVLERMKMDKRILRYLVADSALVNSSSIQDEFGVQYIYVKPGEASIGVSNLDFVQVVYAENGINLKKHTSHIGGQETVVLYITMSDIAKLPRMQQDFLTETAPIGNGMNFRLETEMRKRRTELINKTYKNVLPQQKNQQDQNER